MLTDATFCIESLTYTRTSGWSAPFPKLDSPATLVLVFGASSFTNDHAAVADLCRAYPTSVIAGCSTAGEISGATLADESLSVSVIRFSKTRLALASAPVRNSADSFRAGDAIARQLDTPDLRAIFLLSDGLNVNGTELSRGVNSVVGNRVLVTGGLAGDGQAFKQAWVLRNGSPVNNFVTAVGFYGPHVRVGHASRGGWDTFGPERRVTRSSGNTLFALDHEPALAIYKKYLGDRAQGLPATALLFPLAIRARADAPESLVRTILSVNEQEQSMTFAGDIPEGATAQLMCANFERLIQGACDSGRLARGGLDDQPCLCIAISCVGRRLVLGERTEEELEGTLDAMPDGSTQVGFYSYGEISPLTDGSCELHNQTMTLTTITEC